MRPALGLLAAVIGGLTAIASVATHDGNWAWFLLAVGAPAATVVALPTGWLRIGFALGWVLLVLVAVQGTGAGSFAISADLRGYLFLGSGLALMVGAVVTLPIRPARESAATLTAHPDNLG